MAHQVTPCCILSGIPFVCLLQSQVNLHSTKSIVSGSGSKPWLRVMHAMQHCPWTDHRASAVAHATSIRANLQLTSSGKTALNTALLWPCSCFSPDALPQHQQSPSCWLSCGHGLHVFLETPLRLLVCSHLYTLTLIAGRTSCCCARNGP